jgi:hypothetical protein
MKALGFFAFCAAALIQTAAMASDNSVVWGTANQSRHSANSVVWGTANQSRHSANSVVWGTANRSRHAVGTTAQSNTVGANKVETQKPLNLNEGF